jgi:hypothetical protein
VLVVLAPQAQQLVGNNKGHHPPRHLQQRWSSSQAVSGWRLWVQPLWSMGRAQLGLR